MRQWDVDLRAYEHLDGVTTSLNIDNILPAVFLQHVMVLNTDRHGYMDAWVDRWMDGCMDGWTDRTEIHRGVSY